MSQRDEFITWVHTVLRDAQVAGHNGDPSPRRANWSQQEPVTVLGAWRNAVGQAELDELFVHLAESFSECTSYEFEFLEAEVPGDTAYTVGCEHTSGSVNGVPNEYPRRATRSTVVKGARLEGGAPTRKCAADVTGIRGKYACTRRSASSPSTGSLDPGAAVDPQARTTS